ncbi:MAG: DUF2628 domain-containing protein [Ruminococcus sp.]|nr:DUF2628 domain-containing protein [Ruminococcus sp.]
MNYIGERCVVCNNVFDENSDVVVCPECGAPHHRECYMKENRCGFFLSHIGGVKWERTVTRNAEPEISRTGENYYTEEETAAENAFHEERFNITEDEYLFSAKFLGYNPNEDIGGATIKEAADFVKSNKVYYIPIFKRMKDMGKKISFNILSLLFPQVFFANRKMWGWALISSALSVILSIPAALMIVIDDGMQNGYQEFTSILTDFLMNNRSVITAITDICSFFEFGIRILFCLFGNSLYYRFVLKNLKKFRKIGISDEKTLSQAGGVSFLNILGIIAINFFMAMFCFFMVIAFLHFSVLFISG